MNIDPMADDVYQPTENDVREEDAARLDDLEDAVEEPSYDELLDEGYSPPEKPLGVTKYGTTAAEQRAGESLDQRLAQEEPDVREPEGDGVGDLPGGDGELMDPEAGEARAGRLMAPDEHIPTPRRTRSPTTWESTEERPVPRRPQPNTRHEVPALVTSGKASRPLPAAAAAVRTSPRTASTVSSSLVAFSPARNSRRPLACCADAVSAAATCQRHHRHRGHRYSRPTHTSCLRIAGVAGSAPALTRIGLAPRVTMAPRAGRRRSGDLPDLMPVQVADVTVAFADEA